jgi:hypothetical protein
LRSAVHVLASVAMWCLFGYYWKVVLDREIGPGTLRAMSILGAVVLAGLAVTVFWIRHNLRLARRFEGRRRGVRAVPPATLERDTIGRPIGHPPLDALRAAQVIDIHTDHERKVYRIPPREEAS